MTSIEVELTPIGIADEEKTTQYDSLPEKSKEKYISKKSKVLTADNVEKFLKEAPDEKYLLTKAVLIFGITGACTQQEIAYMNVSDIEDHGDYILVKIADTKNKIPRTFTISGNFYKIVKRYQALRVTIAGSSRYFQNFQKGKCTRHVIGVNKIGNLTKEIAAFLKLPNSDAYISFRRIAASLAISETNITASHKTLRELKLPGSSKSLESSLLNSDEDLNSDDDIASDGDYSTSVPKNTTKKGSIDNGTSTGDTVNCKKCGKQINTGFRWKCLECEYYEVCSLCEAKRVHGKHFVLRVPAHKPQCEVERVVTALRRELQLGRHSEEMPQDDINTAQEQKEQGDTTEEPDTEQLIIKTEIKEELPDPLAATTQYPESSNLKVDSPMEQSYITVEMVKTEPMDEIDVAPTSQGGEQGSVEDNIPSTVKQPMLFSISKQPPSKHPSEATKRSAPPLPPPPLTKRPAVASKTEIFTHTSSGKASSRSASNQAKNPSGPASSQAILTDQSASSQITLPFDTSMCSQTKQTSGKSKSRKIITICEKSASNQSSLLRPVQLTSNQGLPCEVVSSQDYANTPSQSASSQSYLNAPGQSASSQDLSETYGQSASSQDLSETYGQSAISQDLPETSGQSASSQATSSEDEGFFKMEVFSHGSRNKETGKSRADYMRDYRRKKREEKLKSGMVKKVARNSTERSRDFRARQRAQLYNDNVDCDVDDQGNSLE